MPFHITFAPGIPFALGFALAAVGVVILGISKSGFGGGVGILAVPLFAITFGAQRGTAILLPLLIAADVFSVYHHWGKWDKHVLRLLVPGTLAGIVVGSIILWLLVVGPIAPWHFDWSQWGHPAPLTPRAKAARDASADALNLITGVVSVLYVLLDQVRTRFAPAWKLTLRRGSGFAAGTSVGVISTLAHAAGPVAAIFLLNQGLPRAMFLGTTVIYFFGINTVKLIPYTLIPGLTDWPALLIGLCFLPFAPLGTFVGKRLSERLSERLFRNLILLLTFATGLQLIAEYATGIKLTQLVARLFGPTA